MSPQPLPSAVAIRRVPGLPHPMSLPRRGLTLYWVALSAVPSPRWRADFLWPPPVLRTATYTPAVGRLGLPGARIIFRTSPSRLRHWLRRIDRWIADANSVVEERRRASAPGSYTVAQERPSLLHVVIKEITLAPRRVGMRIKRLREEKGWTQAELAARLGLSRVHVANIESPDDAPHHRTPSLATLEKLAKAFRMKVADLLG